MVCQNRDIQLLTYVSLTEMDELNGTQHSSLHQRTAVMGQIRQRSIPLNSKAFIPMGLVMWGFYRLDVIDDTAVMYEGGVLLQSVGDVSEKQREVDVFLVLLMKKYKNIYIHKKRLYYIHTWCIANLKTRP